MISRTKFAFVPLRGGSKGIPGKNIRLFCGRPLAYWVLRSASECMELSQIFVATDSDDIRETVEQFKLPKVQVIDRSAHTCTDQASTESALLEFAGGYAFDVVALLQATNPFLSSEELSQALELFESSQLDSLVSVVRQHRFFWQTTGESARPLNYDPMHRPRRQEWNGVLMENGSFYLSTRDALLASKCRVSGKIGVFEMNPYSAFEIDSKDDWKMAESMFSEIGGDTEAPALASLSPASYNQG